MINVDFLALQPNGLYCGFLYSLGQPSFINMTREDCLQDFRYLDRADVLDMLAHHVQPFSKVLDAYDYLPSHSATERDFLDMIVTMSTPVKTREHLNGVLIWKKKKLQN